MPLCAQIRLSARLSALMRDTSFASMSAISDTSATLEDAMMLRRQKRREMVRRQKSTPEYMECDPLARPVTPDPECLTSKRVWERQARAWRVELRSLHEARHLQCASSVCSKENPKSEQEIGALLNVEAGPIATMIQRSTLRPAHSWPEGVQILADSLSPAGEAGSGLADGAHALHEARWESM